MSPGQGLFPGHQSPQPLLSQSARPAGCGVARAPRCCSPRAGVAREGGGQSRRNAPEPQVSGGLCSPCHLGTAHTDDAWAPGARHLRARRQPRRGGCGKAPRRGCGEGHRPGSPAPQTLHFQVIFLNSNLKEPLMICYGPRSTVRCYTLTSLGCAAFFCCFAVESNAVKGKVLDSGQAFPGPPGPGGVGS